MVSCTSCTFYQVAMCSGLCVFFCSGLGPQKRWTPNLCLQHICFTGRHRINVAGKALLQNYTMMYGILALYCILQHTAAAKRCHLSRTHLSCRHHWKLHEAAIHNTLGLSLRCFRAAAALVVSSGFGGRYRSLGHPSPEGREYGVRMPKEWRVRT